MFQLDSIKTRKICYVIDTNKERMVDAHLQQMHSVNPIDCACAITYKMWSENKDNPIFHTVPLINNYADCVKILDFHHNWDFRSLLDEMSKVSLKHVLPLDRFRWVIEIVLSHTFSILLLLGEFP